MDDVKKSYHEAYNQAIDHAIVIVSLADKYHHDAEWVINKLKEMKESV